MLCNMIRHFLLVMRHKRKVFKLCCKAGIPVRGFFHDMSKFSPTEFFESAKFYTGKKSPITNSRIANGYSKAWLHHKAHNKHHYEYWFDEELPEKMPIIPYKYVAEMICDNLAAGMTYLDKEWNNGYQLKYWERKKGKITINPVVENVLTEVFEKVSKEGVDNVIKPKVLRKIYDENVAKNR